MSETTAVGEAAVTTFMKVEKADGRVLYFRVADDQTVEITQAEYEEYV